jgi:hypothetical protein
LMTLARRTTPLNSHSRISSIKNRIIPHLRKLLCWNIVR